MVLETINIIWKYPCISFTFLSCQTFYFIIIYFLRCHFWMREVWKTPKIQFAAVQAFCWCGLLKLWSKSSILSLVSAYAFPILFLKKNQSKNLLFLHRTQVQPYVNDILKQIEEVLANQVRWVWWLILILFHEILILI